MTKGRLPINFYDQPTWAEVASATWRSVFDAAGETSRLVGESISAQLLAKSIQEQKPGEALYHAMETIYELRSEDARDLIVQAAADQQQSIPINRDLPIAEYCAQLWVLSVSDKKLRFILECAREKFRETLRERTYREFARKGDAKIDKFDMAKLKLAIEAWYEKDGATKPIRIDTHKQDGEYLIEVVKGEPTKRVSEVKENEIRLLDYCPAGSDFLRYDPVMGRIGIRTRSTKLLQGYRKVLGDVIGGSEDFFSNENVCSLVELRNQKGKLFNRSFQGILRVEVQALVWRRGERDTVHVRARDCFQTLESMKASLVEGDIIEAKLKVTFSGRAKPGTVSLKVPNRIDIDAGANESLVEQMLDEVGIRGAFDESGERKNFWSRYPWKMSETEYRRWLGQEFDKLVKAQVVRGVRLDFVTHPDHPAMPDALKVVELDANTAVGISTDAAIATRTLTPTDVSGFELNLQKLASSVAASLKLEGEIKEVASGLWSLGNRQLTQAKKISAFLVTRQLADETSALIKSIHTPSDSEPILLVPECCTFNAPGFTKISCKLPAGQHNRLLGPIIRSLGVQAQFTPPEYMSEQLIVDTQKGEVWLGGVLLTALSANTHGFIFVSRLAKAQGQVVKNAEIDKAINSGRSDGETPKKARNHFATAVKKSFVHQKLDPPNLNEVVKNGGGGYTLLCEAAVL